MTVESDEKVSVQTDVGSVLDRARAVAVDYYRLTGRPLGITGEVGEFEAARLLGLELAPAREAGFDAFDASGHRYQIKARWLTDAANPKSQRVGRIKLTHPWDSVLLVILDKTLHAVGIWEAEREAIVAALIAPGSRARNERGALAVSQFQRIGRRVWPKP